MPDRIVMSEVLQELKALEAVALDGPDGFSAQDLADHMKVCHRQAAYRIREWSRLGLVRFVGKRRQSNISGGTAVVPVYQVCSASGS